MCEEEGRQRTNSLPTRGDIGRRHPQYLVIVLAPEAAAADPTHPSQMSIHPLKLAVPTKTITLLFAATNGLKYLTRDFANGGLNGIRAVPKMCEAHETAIINRLTANPPLHVATQFSDPVSVHI